MSKKREKLSKFPERFRALREEREMNQADFATYVDIARPSVGAYEHGERIPDAAVLAKICEKCDVSSDYLLGISDEPKYEDRFVTAVSLGLSGKSIRVLQENEDIASTVNVLLEAESKRGYKILSAIDDFLRAGATVGTQYVYIENKTGITEVSFEPLSRNPKDFYPTTMDELLKSSLSNNVRERLIRFKESRLKQLWESDSDA